MRNNRRLEQEYPYLYGGGRRHYLPFRIVLWIISGTLAGIAVSMLFMNLTKSFHIILSDETTVLIQVVTVCITICICTVAGHLFQDSAKANRNDADMQYESAPKWKCFLKEALTMLVLDGAAAALIWFLLQETE